LKQKIIASFPEKNKIKISPIKKNSNDKPYISSQLKNRFVLQGIYVSVVNCPKLTHCIKEFEFKEKEICKSSSSQT
jgi:hypothetical protein